jgi:hypothetical protein
MSSHPPYPRPDASEYAPFYAGYIAGVPDGDLLDTLRTQGRETAALLAGIPAAKHDFAYAPGKWTLKEVIGHIGDAERIFSYRMLRIARGDATPLPGFDENAYVPASGAKDRTLADLAAELGIIRAATLALLEHLPPGAGVRRGTSNNKEISVRALAWITAGHERHHLKIVRERYLA